MFGEDRNKNGYNKRQYSNAKQNTNSNNFRNSNRLDSNSSNYRNNNYRSYENQYNRGQSGYRQEGRGNYQNRYSDYRGYRNSQSNYPNRESQNRNFREINNSYNSYSSYNEYNNYGNNYGKQSNLQDSKNVKKRSGGLFGIIGEFFGNVFSSFSLIKPAKQSNAKVINNKSQSIKRNRVALPIFLMFSLLSLVYIIGLSVNFLTKKIVNYDVLAYGSIDSAKSANAIIVRDEIVYNTDKKGVITYNVADNERVKKNSIVCSVKDEAVVKQMQDSLDEINAQIMKIQSERKDISVYSDDIKKYNSQIQDIVDESAIDFAYMSLEDVYEFKNNIQKSLDTRNQYLLSEDSEAIKDLVVQKREQESKLNENISNIVAKESGVVSYYIDGLEGEITPENMQSISKKTISDSVSSESSFKSSIKANSPAFKLVKSNVWYIVAYIDSKYVEGWEKNSTRYIYVKDNNGEEHRLEGYIEELVDTSAKEKFVIFRITKDMLDFINVRNITIETESSERGYKIPNSAIMEETLLRIPTSYVDGDSNVLKVSGNSTTKINVSVSGKDPEDSNYCYIPLQLGTLNVDTTLKSPNGEETFVISDVKSVKGVYIVNKGIAEYKTINLTNSVSNNTHTILDPTYNTNIYIYDRVMTEPKDVKKEEIIYWWEWIVWILKQI